MMAKYSKIGFTCIVVLLIIAGISSVNLRMDNDTDGILTLVRPVVAGGTSFLNQEAGISAYTNVGQSIDLSKAKTAFRTVERETARYIVGSVPLFNYPQSEDVHAYVHKDGWIISYYLKNEPASKIVDWENYNEGQQMTTTKLEEGIIVVCNVAEIMKGDIYYYDFRYPNANKLMIIADAMWAGSETSNTFYITLSDTGLIFYERSYSHCIKSTSSRNSVMSINNNQISSLSISGIGTNYDSFLPSQLNQGPSHEIKITRSYASANTVFGAIVLIYKEV